MKILAVVVTYYPERELLEKNVSAFINDVDKVLIWENTPETERLEYRFIDDEKAEYCGDGINSISHALNYAWHYAADNGFDYLLTMDQDSVFENFPRYRDAVICHNRKEQCIVGPETEKKDMDGCEEFVSVPAIITSGMLISIPMLNALNGYCEAFAVDAVDSELCVKATSKGYKVYLHSRTLLLHQFGNTTSDHHNKPVLVRNYSASRLYGIFRNHIILHRKYRDNVWLKDILKAYFWIYFVGVILYDTQKVKKVVSMLRGIKEGLFFDIDRI